VTMGLAAKSVHANVKAKLQEVFTNRAPKTVDQASREVKAKEAARKQQNAATAGEGVLTDDQVRVAVNLAFKDMPKFGGKGVTSLKNWLDNPRNGFSRAKSSKTEEGITFPGTRSANQGGSEIWMRGRVLKGQKMIECVRIDELGHDPKFAKAGTQFTFPSCWVKLEGPGGARPYSAYAHFHKEVIAADMNTAYVERYVRNKLDFDDAGTEIEAEGDLKWALSHIHTDPKPAGSSGGPQPGRYPSTGAPAGRPLKIW